MKKLKNILFLAAGIAIGATLSGPAVHAAAGLLANPTTQKFYLQNQQIQLEAYVINGNNYVKLRDVGAAVDFGVAYDARTNSVTIDPDSPYVSDTEKLAQDTGGALSSQASLMQVRPAGEPEAAPLLLLSPPNPLRWASAGTSEIPKVGDKIKCPDGSAYEIKDVSRYDGSMFAEGPVGPLPEAACDWSGFDQIDPQPEARRFQVDGSDYLFQRNTYEVKRIACTLYNGMGNLPELWVNGQAKRRADGSPYIHLIVGAPQGQSVTGFWPWKDSRVLDILEACPCGDLYIDAWDVYKDGVFLRTEYQIF